MSDHFPAQPLQSCLTGLVVVAELDVLAVDDGLLLAGLTAGARLQHRLAGRGQTGGDLVITDRRAAGARGGE